MPQTNTFVRKDTGATLPRDAQSGVSSTTAFPVVTGDWKLNPSLVGLRLDLELGAGKPKIKAAETPGTDTPAAATDEASQNDDDTFVLIVIVIGLYMFLRSRK